MWFLFGLITLLGSCVMVYRHRRDDRWIGFPSGRLHYEQRRNPKTGHVVLLRVGIAIDPSLDFELKRESRLDRLAKWLGVSEEAQVGRPSFDATCYVVSDDIAVRARLQRDSSFTDSLQEIASFDAGYRFHRLVCRNGRLRVELRAISADPPLEPTLGSMRRQMEAMADQLPSVSGRSRHRARDPYLLRSLLILAATSGLAISGAAQMVRIALMKFPFTVDWGQLWALSLPVSAALLCLLVAATAVLLNRTSRAHLVLLEVLLIGSLGALMTALVEVRDLNIDADRSTAILLPAQIVDRRINRGRRGRRSYSLVLTDWNGRGNTRSVAVSRSQYDTFLPGQSIVVRQRAGFLGVRWVEGMSAP